ncbi:dipeptidase [Amycolatopsis sp. GM8]|uniref:dipeptidase n=1 Tax=Amycolatopsis sp. GM8 TaxID=2896530 RepID=UPI001F20FF21|nr:membrane dipeptidase [Amycolatopsis sp. GM8]
MITENTPGFDAALVWDQHGCLPLHRNSTIDDLHEYVRAGFDFVSVNVGMDGPWQDTLETLMNFRGQILDNPSWTTLAGTAQEVSKAKEAGKLAVAFDLEGTEGLDGKVGLVETYYQLGVRTMLIAYNVPNRAGGGCHGDPEDGLTAFGRDVVREMNRVGMVVDATHCARRTTFDLFEHSTSPVIFSHSVPSGVHRHPRNIDDDQLRECARTGGVIGINGVGIFLGDNVTATEDLFRAVDYAVGVAGIDHVGIGLDYVFDQAEANGFIKDDPDSFPADGNYLPSDGAPIGFVHPRQLRELSEVLTRHGYSDSDVRAILGENFRRVAAAVWR